MGCMLAIRLSEKLDGRLAKLARKTKQTKTALARQAILEHLDDLEDYFEANRRIEENLKSIPLDEVEKRLGLSD